MVHNQSQEQSVIVSKTELGAQVMKDRSVHMSAQQRSALILCDGKRSAQEVVRMTAAVGVSMKDIETLVALGLVTMDAATSTAPPVGATVQVATTATATALPAPSGTAQDTSALDLDFSAALNAAITLCSNIGFRGFGLNMALTGVDNLEKLQKIAPEIRRVAGDAKYKPLHELIFGKAL